MKHKLYLHVVAWSFILASLPVASAIAQSPQGMPVRRAGSVAEPTSALMPTSAVTLEQDYASMQAAMPACGCGSSDCLGCESVCSAPCWNWCDQWFFNGWLEQGFTGNPDSDGGLLGPAGTNGPLIFNDQANEYMLNQLYLSFGRSVNQDSCEWDLGGRVDVLYGTDYYFIQATGLETYDNNGQKWNSGNGPRNAGTAGLYGLALPQFYLEANVPWGNGLNVKAGHFYTIMGYESVMAPENFFYSHSYMMQYGEPFTHTGVLASYPTSSCITWYGGVTRGWNTFDQPNGQVGFLGGFRWVSPHEATKLNFTLQTGSEDPTGENNRTTYSLVFQQRINQCWTYVMEHNLGVEQNARLTTSNTLAQATWYGISNYLYYTVDPCTDLGVRFEWFNDPDNARVFALPNDNITTGGNYFELTLGANYHPTSWFILRPEVRWDWSDVQAPGISGVYNNGTSDNQFTIGFDLITVF
ncbi:porin [Bremerella sp. JC817]|uniref:porin n=1 Tax=Bremerella sp. JC817 TaxID=3231756 RepID=UPI00345A0055